MKRKLKECEESDEVVENEANSKKVKSDGEKYFIFKVSQFNML